MRLVPPLLVVLAVGVITHWCQPKRWACAAAATPSDAEKAATPEPTEKSPCARRKTADDRLDCITEQLKAVHEVLRMARKEHQAQAAELRELEANMANLRQSPVPVRITVEYVSEVEAVGLSLAGRLAAVDWFRWVMGGGLALKSGDTTLGATGFMSFIFRPWRSDHSFMHLVGINVTIRGANYSQPLGSASDPWTPFATLKAELGVDLHFPAFRGGSLFMNLGVGLGARFRKHQSGTLTEFQFGFIGGIGVQFWQ